MNKFYSLLLLTLLGFSSSTFPGVSEQDLDDLSEGLSVLGVTSFIEQVKSFMLTLKNSTHRIDPRGYQIILTREDTRKMAAEYTTPQIKTLNKILGNARIAGRDLESATTYAVFKAHPTVQTLPLFKHFLITIEPVGSENIKL